MQNTLKSLEEKTQNIEKLLEKGNDVIVFQLGSHSIKYGFANQNTPQKILNIIGYLMKSGSKKETKAQSGGKSDLEDFDQNCLNIENTLKKRGNIKVDLKAVKIKTKNKSEIRVSEREDFFLKPDEDSLRDKVLTPDVIFDKEVLLKESTNQYIINKPIRFGMFNISNEYKVDAILNDLEKLVCFRLK